jgi:hypothetical protein
MEMGGEATVWEASLSRSAGDEALIQKFVEQVDEAYLEIIEQLGQGEADVVQEAAVEPAAPGLDLICRGLRRVSVDGLAALEHGVLIYDALYAELKAENQTGGRF